MNDMGARDAAAILGIGHQTLKRKAKALGIGVNWRGSRGYRFTLTDLSAIRDAQRPVPVPARRRRRMSTATKTNPALSRPGLSGVDGNNRKVTRNG